MSRHATWQAIFILGLVACLVATGCSGFFVEPQLSTITISPASPSLVTGATQQFTAVGTYSDGSTSVIGSAAWSTSNVTVLAVNTSGVATAIGAGSVTLSASSGAATGSTTVTVETSPLSSIAISPINPSVSLASTTTQQFTATATFTDGSTRDVSSSVTWSSSNTTIATINSTGLATLIKAGTTTIKATSGAITQQTTLTVTQ